MNVRVWSPEEEAELLRLYIKEEYDIEEIAEAFNKNTRSIISKLVQLKVYKKIEADRPARRSVKSMILELEILLGISINGVNLTKKANLETLVDAIKNKVSNASESN